MLGSEIDLDPADGIGLRCQAAVKAGVFLRLGSGESREACAKFLQSMVEAGELGIKPRPEDN
jgi:hypothetical protein